jgi:hypothetical protein
MTQGAGGVIPFFPTDTLLHLGFLRLVFPPVYGVTSKCLQLVRG